MKKPRSALSHAHYYVGTDGRITVWRRTFVKTYRSVIINEFTRSFRETAPSGPNSFPVEQIGSEEYHRLIRARGGAKRGAANESWIDNADIPKDLILPIPTAVDEEE